MPCNLDFIHILYKYEYAHLVRIPLLQIGLCFKFPKMAYFNGVQKKKMPTYQLAS